MYNKYCSGFTKFPKLMYNHYTTVDQWQFLLDPSPIIADIDAEERVDDILFGQDFEGLEKILNLDFGHKIETEVWSRFWSIYLVETLRLSFGQDFELNSWSRLWGWDFVNLMKLKFAWDSEIEFWSTWGFPPTSGASSQFDESSQPKGPLCLWQCFHKWPTEVFD